MTTLRGTAGYKGGLGTAPNTTFKSLPSSQSLEPTYRLSVRFRTYLAARDLLALSAVITLASFLVEILQLSGERMRFKAPSKQNHNPAM